MIRLLLRKETLIYVVLSLLFAFIGANMAQQRQSENITEDVGEIVASTGLAIIENDDSTRSIIRNIHDRRNLEIAHIIERVDFNASEIAALRAESDSLRAAIRAISIGERLEQRP